MFFSLTTANCDKALKEFPVGILISTDAEHVFPWETLFELMLHCTRAVIPLKFRHDCFPPPVRYNPHLS